MWTRIDVKSKGMESIWTRFPYTKTLYGGDTNHKVPWYVHCDISLAIKWVPGPLYSKDKIRVFWLRLIEISDFLVWFLFLLWMQFAIIIIIQPVIEQQINGNYCPSLPINWHLICCVNQKLLHQIFHNSVFSSVFKMNWNHYSHDNVFAFKLLFTR